MTAPPDVLLVIAYALLAVLATGLGALPFPFIRALSPRVLGFGNALAAGLMLAASFNLVYEGLETSMPRTALGILAGLGFIVLSRRWLAHRDPPSALNLRGADVLQALLIVGVTTLHSFAEGIGVGVAFGGGQDFGTFISLAIAVHNIPEGLAIALVLIPKGVSVGRAGLWSVVSSLPQPLTAGAMIWMAFSELLPEALAEVSHEGTAVTVTVTVAAMTAFLVLIG